MIAIIEAYRAGLLNVKFWAKNIRSGVVVGMIALPLAMAFAIASGVKPEQGIYTAIIAAIIVGLFGGSRVQIAGPTGAFVVVLANITAQHGVAGLQLATIMAGFILLSMSLFKLGNSIKYVPYPVIVGFTSGIGVIIFIGEIKDFLGLNLELAINAPFHIKIITLIKAIPHFDPITTLIAFASLILLIVIPMFIRIIPAAIIALITITLINTFFNFDSVSTIGTIYGEIPRSLPSFALPEFKLSTMLKIFEQALIIAFLGAIESLLSATSADAISNTKHDSNSELFGQGLANVVTPFFGGIAATGAIARTIANVRHGGNSPIAAITHSITLLIIILLFAPYAAHIPLAALAALLFVVAYNMSDFPEFVHILKNAPKHDVLVLLITFILTVVTNLVTAVAVGIILATLLFMSRMQEITKVKYDTQACSLTKIPKNCIVFNIDGPFFFGVAEEVEHALATMHMDSKQIVFRLPGLSMIDMTGLETLSKVIEQYRKRHVKVYICEANQKIVTKMRKIGLLKLIEQHKVYPSIASIEFDMP